MQICELLVSPRELPFPRAISPLPSIRIEQNNVDVCTRDASLDSLETALRVQVVGLVLGKHQ